MKRQNLCFLVKILNLKNRQESEVAKSNDGWYGSILKKLKYASPLSLKVSLRSIREGRYQTLDECVIREYRLTSRAISCQISSDFCEVFGHEWWIKILHQRACIKRHGGAILFSSWSIRA
nr:3-hydroxyisobutyryl-CoA hydrolase-like protein 1, mitochondrial isoform X1 [Tanacetum cinerariifolium]